MDDTVSKNTQTKKSKKLFLSIVFFLLILTVAVSILAIIRSFYPSQNSINSESTVEVTPTITTTPTPQINFDFYQDKFLEFEYPAGSKISVEGGDVSHPSQAGLSITGVDYLSIKQEGKFILENYHFLQGGEFDYVFYDKTRGVYGRYETEYEYGYEVEIVETKLTQEPEIVPLDGIDGYLVKFIELGKIHLMYPDLEEPGVYRSINYGLWTKLDYLGQFSVENEIPNFFGFSCTINQEEDYTYCEKVINRFLDTVKKRFVENEKYIPPKVEAVLDLKDSNTKEIVRGYRFFLDEKIFKDTMIYADSRSITISSIGSNTVNLKLSSFFTIPEYRDIAFSNMRESFPTIDIEGANLFSNLLRNPNTIGVSSGKLKILRYDMFYPDEKDEICYEHNREEGVNYVGCVSRKLKIKGIDANIEAECTYTESDNQGLATCDRLIKSLRVDLNPT